MLEHPLNRILGTEANVRLIRALHAEGGPLTRGQLASVAGLSPVGARRALAALVKTGVVESTGSARAGQYRLRERHPLVPSLRALFEFERSRARELWSRLSALFESLRVQPVSAWVQTTPSVAGDDPSSGLRVIVLVGAAEVRPLREEAASGTARIERELDVMLELVPITRADLLLMKEEGSLDDVRLLHGPPPSSLLPSRQSSTSGPRIKRTQREADLEQLGTGRLIAGMIREDSSLVPKAARRVRQLIQEQNRPASDLKEWLSILDNNSAPQIAQLLETESPRATRLRQSLVFLPVLSAMQRKRLDAGQPVRVRRNRTRR